MVRTSANPIHNDRLKPSKEGGEKWSHGSIGSGDYIEGYSDFDVMIVLEKVLMGADVQKLKKRV